MLATLLASALLFPRPPLLAVASSAIGRGFGVGEAGPASGLFSLPTDTVLLGRISDRDFLSGAEAHSQGHNHLRKLLHVCALQWE